MKTATAVVLLLFAFTSKSYFFGVARADESPVLDSDGDELRTGVEYYVVSAIWGAGGGGLALGRVTGQSCPEIVVQRGFDDDGLPVIFSNADGKDGVVRLSTDVNIEFVPIRDRLCLTSTVWKLDDYDLSTGKWWVTTDGVKGDPGHNTLTSWFKIEDAGALGYKFRFCPSVCDSCIHLCNDFGRHGHDGQVRLALSENGWPWIFKKARNSIKQVVNAKH
ncbi:PREDICTED: 21 kDa seed protein-like [Theobroma cacao]|uniref:21 kDa seed protein-like n=1 Tax=Theobroma cacao TaxID=3641 RepID=A0AB32X3Q1_THECC|nr:PREDICTED: 21 kDa seed protein-like [Theobroma cacao]